MPEFGQGDRAPQEHACYWAQPQAQEGCAVLSLELHGCWEPGGDLISIHTALQELWVFLIAGGLVHMEREAPV